jgi:hypothetical protein
MRAFFLANRLSEMQTAQAMGFVDMRFSLTGWDGEHAKLFETRFCGVPASDRLSVAAPVDAFFAAAAEQAPHLVLRIRATAEKAGSRCFYVSVVLLHKAVTCGLHLMQPPSQHTTNAVTAAQHRLTQLHAVTYARLLTAAEEVWLKQALADAEVRLRMAMELQLCQWRCRAASAAIATHAPALCAWCYAPANRVKGMACRHRVACVRCVIHAQYECVECMLRT